MCNVACFAPALKAYQHLGLQVVTSSHIIYWKGASSFSFSHVQQMRCEGWWSFTMYAVHATRFHYICTSTSQPSNTLKLKIKFIFVTHGTVNVFHIIYIFYSSCAQMFECTYSSPGLSLISVILAPQLVFQFHSGDGSCNACLIDLCVANSQSQSSSK